MAEVENNLQKTPFSGFVFYFSGLVWTRLPVLTNLKLPLPLQMNIFIVVSEEWGDGIISAIEHSRRGLLRGCDEALDLKFWRIGAHHIIGCINWFLEENQILN